VLLAHKERGALPLAGPLGAVLAAAVTGLLRAPGPLRIAEPPRGGSGDGVVELVPVPSARESVARRGHDPVRRIARAAAVRLRGQGLAVRVHPALRRCRPVADQATLGGAQRRANLAGALVAAPRGGRWGGPVVLVDDLITTGASLAEAARAVRAAGPPGAVAGAGKAAEAWDPVPLGAAVVTVSRFGEGAGARR
jgi:predicted amidophosphoribosyltransferase